MGVAGILIPGNKKAADPGEGSAAWRRRSVDCQQFGGLQAGVPGK
jgi:hypothetical protein